MPLSLSLCLSRARALALCARVCVCARARACANVLHIHRADRYAGVDKGIPIVTLELPPHVSTWSRAQLWTVYGGAMLAALHY